MRSSAQARRLSVSPVNFAGKISKATLPTWRAGHFVPHVPLFLRAPCQLRRTNIHGDPAKKAYRADASSAPACFLESGHGDSARASTPLSWYANVALRTPTRVSSQGNTQVRTCRRAPSNQLPRRCGYFPTWRGRLQRSQNGAEFPGIASPPTSLPRLVSVSSA